MCSAVRVLFPFVFKALFCNGGLSVHRLTLISYPGFISTREKDGWFLVFPKCSKSTLSSKYKAH